MHFSLQNKPKNVLKNTWVIFLLFVLALIFLGAVYVYQGMFGVYFILFLIICTIIAVSVKSIQKRSVDEFDTTESGIVVNGKVYAWPEIRYYSWYGEKQSDRVGVVGFVPLLNYDPINPYRFAKTQILQLNLGLRGSINLQIDSAQVEGLSSILRQYGVKHISMIQKVVGV